MPSTFLLLLLVIAHYACRYTDPSVQHFIADYYVFVFNCSQKRFEISLTSSQWADLALSKDKVLNQA